MDLDYRIDEQLSLGIDLDNTSPSPGMPTASEAIKSTKKSEYYFQSNSMEIDEVQLSSSLSLLEGKLDDYAMDIILSYLTLVEYSNLSIASTIMQQRVSRSTHLFLEDYRLFKKRLAPSIHQQETAVAPREPFVSVTPQKELQRLLNRFSNVNVLNLQGLAPVGDDLIDILNRCPSASTLKSITLHSCALSYWCAHSFQLPNLESLTLTGNSIRSRMILLLQHSTNLKSLTFKQCPALRDGDIASISRILHTNIEELILNHTKLSKPVASFPRLTRASFAGGFCLTSLSTFHCPNLKILNLSFCVRLSEIQVEKIVANSPLLETLIIVKCAGVHSLDLETRNLRCLDMGFTHNLQHLRLACPALRHLDTTCCSSLQRVSLENCHNLSVLDLGGSLQLQSLRLKEAMSLTQLTLRGCRQLNYCYIDSPNLQYADLDGCRKGAVRHCKDIQEAMDCREKTVDLRLINLSSLP